MNSGLPFKGSTYLNERKVVNVNMLAGESPVRLCMQIRLRGSLNFRFHTWLGFLPADELMLFLFSLSLFLLKIKS